jgi:hypothetical protein
MLSRTQPKIVRQLSNQGLELLRAGLAGDGAVDTSSKTLAEEIKPLVRPSSPRVLVVVPVGVPCCGKSTAIASLGRQVVEHFGIDTISLDPNAHLSSLASQLEREGNPKAIFVVRSSDSTAASLLNRQRKGAVSEKERSRALKAASKAFAQSVSDTYILLSKVVKEDPSCQAILLLDKNHPPNAWQGTVRRLREMAQKERVPACIVSVIPNELMGASEPQWKHPFHPALLLLCLARLSGRHDHPTLNGTDSGARATLLRFFKFYQRRSGGFGASEEEVLSNMRRSGFDLVGQYSVLGKEQLPAINSSSLNQLVFDCPPFGQDRRIRSFCAQMDMQLGALGEELLRSTVDDDLCKWAASVSTSPEEIGREWLESITAGLVLDMAERQKLRPNEKERVRDSIGRRQGAVTRRGGGGGGGGPGRHKASRSYHSSSRMKAPLFGGLELHPARKETFVRQLMDGPSSSIGRLKVLGLQLPYPAAMGEHADGPVAAAGSFADAIAASSARYTPTSSTHVTSWVAKKYFGEKNTAVKAWLDTSTAGAQVGASGSAGGQASAPADHCCRHRGFVVASEHLVVVPVTQLSFPSLKPHPHITVATCGCRAAASGTLLGAVFNDRSADSGGGEGDDSHNDWLAGVAAAVGTGTVLMDGSASWHAVQAELRPGVVVVRKATGVGAKVPTVVELRVPSVGSVAITGDEVQDYTVYLVEIPPVHAGCDGVLPGQVRYWYPLH